MKRSSRPRAAAELSKSLHQQLNKYALAAGAAGVGLLASAQPSEAKIVYTPAHVHIGDKAVPLDLNHDGIVEIYVLQNFSHNVIDHTLFACQFVTSYNNVPYCLNSKGTNAIRGVVSEGRWFGAALRAGARIKHSDPFLQRTVVLGELSYVTNGVSNWFGPWLNGGKGVKNRYLGLRFKIKGRFHFGWARMTVETTQNNFTAILTGYAYETIPGKGIVAGKTKGPDVTTIDPASLGHLAAGASAIPAWRVKHNGATTH